MTKLLLRLPDRGREEVSNQAIVLAAVQQNGLAIGAAAPETKISHAIVDYAVKTESIALKHLCQNEILFPAAESLVRRRTTLTYASCLKQLEEKPVSNALLVQLLKLL